MERRQETTVTIAELAAQKEAKETADQVQYREILSTLKETGSALQPEAEILSTPQDEIKAIPGIQILTQPAITNKNGDSPPVKITVEEAKTWKKTLKEKILKRLRRS